MQTIDPKTAKEYVMANYPNDPLLKHTVVTLLDQLPKVETVEVVRCKECMWGRPKDHREPTDMPREVICQCAHHHPIPATWHARMAVNPEDFCSYGERRTDGKHP